jgi:hypothetical protein
MKKLIVISALFFGFSAAATEETDSLGLPGDNLDLFGVLDLFKQSASLEDFEKKLNDPTNEINNLDLNNDNDVDYIRVVDRAEGDAHAIILQVPVSATESQDVAAIELEKTGTDAADLQVVGDEELYGEDYIVEAKGETANADAKWQGFRPVVVVNVWMWPAVRFIYAPAYVVWVSPYRWGYYPVYWKPWRPVGWRVHHARAFRYHTHYVCVHHHRMARAHVCYHNHRVGSHSVHQRYQGHHQRHTASQGQRNGAQKTNGAQTGRAKSQKQPQHKQGGAHQQKQPQHRQGGGQKKQGAAGPRKGR